MLNNFTLTFITNYANSGRTDGGYLKTYATFGYFYILRFHRDLLTPDGTRRLRAEIASR